MKKLATLICALSGLLIAVSVIPMPLHAATYDQIFQRWTKSARFEDDEFGGNLEVKATYYSAEFIEATIQKEAKDNLWTQQEADNFKYRFLSTLRLDEMIPINIEFINNGPTMHMGPFDVMVKLRIKNKLYKAADYDKRFNFSFQGKKDGLIFFPRYDEKTGRDLLKDVKNVRLEIVPAISPLLEGHEISFMWDVARDNPSKLYEGTTAARIETERLLKRLENLRKDKADEESRLSAIDNEINTIQSRLDELAKIQ